MVVKKINPCESNDKVEVTADNGDHPLSISKKLTTNKSRLFDKSCSICMGDFEGSERLMNTLCKHSFHEDCLNQWIE